MEFFGALVLLLFRNQRGVGREERWRGRAKIVKGMGFERRACGDVGMWKGEEEAEDVIRLMNDAYDLDEQHSKQCTVHTDASEWS